MTEFPGTALHVAATAALVCLLLAASARDLLVRSIPNPVAIGVALCGLALRMADGTILPALLVGSAVFALLFVIWSRGMIGGGDVKLLAALTLVVPPWQVPSLIFAVTTAGAILGLAYLAAARATTVPRAGRPSNFPARAWRIERRRLAQGGPIPYAVAIALGGLLSICQGV
eukprot:gene12525-12614_t